MIASGLKQHCKVWFVGAAFQQQPCRVWTVLLNQILKNEVSYWWGATVGIFLVWEFLLPFAGSCCPVLHPCWQQGRGAWACWSSEAALHPCCTLHYYLTLKTFVQSLKLWTITPAVPFMATWGQWQHVTRTTPTYYNYLIDMMGKKLHIYTAVKYNSIIRVTFKAKIWNPK